MSDTDTEMPATPPSARDVVAERADVVVSLENISMKFGDYTAVQDVSFEVATGKFLSIVGPSGCGKSTLLNLDIRIFSNLLKSAREEQF